MLDESCVSASGGRSEGSGWAGASEAGRSPKRRHEREGARVTEEHSKKVMREERTVREELQSKAEVCSA